MAAPAHDAALSRRVDSFLGYLLREWQAVPELAEEWGEWSDAERLDYASDWAIREDRLMQLEALAAAGQLSPRQQQQYAALQTLVAQHRAALNQLFQGIGLPGSEARGTAR
jgi:hypothetical protein